MFEQALAKLLHGILGELVEDGSILSERVQLGVWSGYVVLEQLVLRKSFLESLRMPISLHYGLIGRLELRIPWASIAKDPIVVIIDEILLLLEPKYEWTTAAAKSATEQSIKQAKLAAVDAFFNTYIFRVAKNMMFMRQRSSLW
jgi:vacuolar protein sorting-associated protein 13A/C